MNIITKTVIALSLTSHFSAHAIDLRVDNIRVYQSNSQSFSAPSSLYIDDGKIVNVAKATDPLQNADKTIDANNQRVEKLLGDLEGIDDKYRDKIDTLKDDLNEAENLNSQEIAELKAEVAKLDSALRMGEDLYRVLADQVREQSYDIKDLNR